MRWLHRVLDSRLADTAAVLASLSDGTKRARLKAKESESESERRKERERERARTAFGECSFEILSSIRISSARTLQGLVTASRKYVAREIDALGVRGQLQYSGADRPFNSPCRAHRC